MHIRNNITVSKQESMEQHSKSNGTNNPLLTGEENAAKKKEEIKIDQTYYGLK